MPFRPLCRGTCGTLGLIFCCLAVSPAAAGPSECPAAIVGLFFHGVGGYSTISTPVYDTTFVPYAPYYDAHVAFDRTLARLSVTATGPMWVGVRVVERFDITGVPPGTPVSGTLVYRLDGLAVNNCGGGGCGVSFGGRLVCGSDSTSANADIGGPCSHCERVLAATLSVPVTFLAGAPVEAAFTLDYHTTFAGWGDVYGTGTWRVTELPPDVRAIACVGADVTPARFFTWGGLKVRYR